MNLAWACLFITFSECPFREDIKFNRTLFRMSTLKSKSEKSGRKVEIDGKESKDG